MAADKWYTERLEEEQRHLNAINTLIDKLDIDQLTQLCVEVENTALTALMERYILKSKDFKYIERTLDALQGFLRARVEYLAPLAAEETEHVEPLRAEEVHTDDHAQFGHEPN